MRQNLFVHFCFPKYLSTSRFYFASPPNLRARFAWNKLHLLFFYFSGHAFLLTARWISCEIRGFNLVLLYCHLLCEQYPLCLVIGQTDRLSWQNQLLVTFSDFLFFFVLGRANNRNEVLKQRIFKFVFIEVRVIVLCPRKTIVDLQSVSYLKENWFVF